MAVRSSSDGRPTVWLRQFALNFAGIMTAWVVCFASSSAIYYSLFKLWELKPDLLPLQGNYLQFYFAHLMFFALVASFPLGLYLGRRIGGHQGRLMWLVGFSALVFRAATWHPELGILDPRRGNPLAIFQFGCRAPDFSLVNSIGPCITQFWVIAPFYVSVGYSAGYFIAARYGAPLTNSTHVENSVDAPRK